MAQKLHNNLSGEKGATVGRPRFALLRLCLIFFSLVLGFHFIQWTVVPRPYLDALQIFTAEITAALISASGIPLTLKGTHIFLLNTHWKVILECTALSAFIVFTSFIVAYPSTIKSKTLGLLVGLPSLFVANILRLFALAWATKWSPKYAPTVHDYAWQIAFLLLLVLMWLAWIELVVKRETSSVISD